MKDSEKIVLLVLLIGIFLVIFINQKNQEKLDVSINVIDNVRKKCIIEYINKFSPEINIKNELYKNFINQLSSLFVENGLLLRNKIIKSEIKLDMLLENGTRNIDSLESFKNIIIIDNKGYILILYKGPENNLDNGIILLDFINLNFVLYRINNIDILYKKYENDNISFGYKINNNNFYRSIKSTDPITMDLILTLQSDINETILKNYLDEKTLKIDLSIIIQDMLKNEQLDKCISGASQAASQSASPVEKCVDKNNFCGDWASKGECNKNPNYMLYNCPVSCNSCDKIAQSTDKIAQSTDKIAQSTPQPMTYDKTQICSEFITDISNIKIQKEKELMELKNKQVSDINNTNLINSDKNYMYKLDSKDNIYSCTKPCNGNWVKIPGSLRQITSDGQNLYGVNSISDIYTCKVPCDKGGWSRIQNPIIRFKGGKTILDKLKSIDANHSTSLFGVSDFNYFSCNKPCLNSNWKKMN
jgi:hypothetical protein